MALTHYPGCDGEPTAPAAPAAPAPSGETDERTNEGEKRR